LPARAVATGLGGAGQELTTSSAAALLAEYGSLPPRKWSSRYGVGWRTSYTLSVVTITVASALWSVESSDITRAVPITLVSNVTSGTR
jgi:hypothetical protein